MDQASLDALRDELSELDRQLLDLADRRTRISLRIGRAKRDLGRGTRDFAREKVVLQRARAQADQLGMDPSLAEQLLLRLIEASLSAQEQDRITHTSTGSGKRALVIGGSGRMGRWFVSFLTAQGYQTTIADPAPGLDGVPWVADWRDLELSHELIVVAAPLDATRQILLSLAERPPTGVIVDIGSLKSPLADALHGLRAAGAQVTSMHPMFGPDTSLLSGRHVVLVDLGVPSATDAVRALFAPTMAELIVLDLDTHDRLMAVVLGLSHAVNLSFSAALAEAGVPLSLLTRLSSTTFDAQLGVAAGVSRENPDLYYEIQAMNPYGAQTLAALQTASAALAAFAQAKDKYAFISMMRDGAAYLDSLQRRG
jgi:chorismate mutase/prephenate dehydrogenase